MEKKHRLRICTTALALCMALVLTACDSNEAVETRRPENDPNAPTRTITLNPNGGTWENGSTDPVTLSVKEGTAIDFAANTPEYEGNILYGWYQADGSPWPGAQKVSGDLELKAKWSVEEIVETYDLTLTLDGETIPLTYENGVYQFNCFTPMYYVQDGGGTQRGGVFTIYMDQFQANMDADDGTTKRLIYRAKSSDQESSGANVVAEFFNDGQFDITYDLLGVSQWSSRMTSTRLATGTWTNVGYTPAFEPEPIPEGLPIMFEPGGISAHWGYNNSFMGVGGPVEQMAPGDVIYTVPSAENAEFHMDFYSNNTVSVLIDKVEYSIVNAPISNGKWSNSDGALTLELDGLAVALTDADNGNVQCVLHGNTFTISPSELAGNS